MKIRPTLYLVISIIISFTSCKQSRTLCQPDSIIDSRDYAENISGETMGQKLESLLFWSQEDRERRFPIMHSIYPSSPVKIGNKKYALGAGIPLQLDKLNDTINLESYMSNLGVKGVIVIENGLVRFEKRAEDIKQNTLWTSFSVAKSVTSMLVGVALKNGDIKSLDDELQLYIQELEGCDYGKITVRQLLTMTSGIAWNEDYGDPHSDVAQMYQKECVGKEAHILSYMKDLKQQHTAGKKFNYNTGETDLLGILVQKASEKSLSAYLSEHIWSPMGMEQCAFWLSDECSGYNIGGSGLSANLRDFARLGVLMLNDGKIGGKQILATEWLDNARSILVPRGEKGGYGYLWWVNADGSYMALGIFGQMVYVNPAKNLVIAQIAAWNQAESKELVSIRQDFIQAVEDAL